MPNWNIFTRKGEDDMPNPNPNPELNTVTEPPQKTQAELIAESVAAALQPIVTTFTERFDSLEANVVRKPAPQQVETTNVAPASVFDDEDAAFAQRVGPLVQRQLATEARLALAEIKQEYGTKGFGEAWTKLESEIVQTLENSPLVDGAGKLCRGDYAYIRNVVDMVFGRAAIKNGVKFGGRDQGFFVENAGGDGGGNVTTGPQNDGLTNEQRRVFQRMGVKPEDGKKTLAKLQFVN